jgi:hypothetical protein
MGIWVSIVLCGESGNCEGVNRLLVLGGLFLAFVVVCMILAALGAMFNALTGRFRSTVPSPHRHRYKMGKCECGELKGAAGSFELPMNAAYREWQDRNR